MKKFNKIVCIIFMLWAVIAQFSYGLELLPISTIPPMRPERTPVPFQTLTPVPLQTLTPQPYQTLFPQITPTPEPPHDLVISNVLKEFQSTGTSGTYYRYYIQVERIGGDLIAASIPVRINTYFAYSGSGKQNTMNLQVNFVEDSTTGIVTATININPLLNGEYPSLYVISIIVDPYDDISETNEDNNTWTCDSVIDDCANCIGPEECYP